MADTESLRPLAPLTLTRRLSVSVLVALLILSFVPTGAKAIETGPSGQVAAQATGAVNEPAPRLQPVGNGDTIDSPAETADEPSSGDPSWWWRVVFGAAVVVVLVALIQRRQVPDRAHGVGRGRNGTRPRSRDDRNALGH